MPSALALLDLMCSLFMSYNQVIPSLVSLSEVLGPGDNGYHYNHYPSIFPSDWGCYRIMLHGRFN